MTQGKRSSRLVYWLIGLVTVLISAFSAITIIQIRWTTELQKKLTENRQQIQSLRTKCAAKLLQDVLLSEHSVNPNRKKRQGGSLQTMLQEMMVAQEKVLLSHCLNNTGLCIKGTKGQSGLKGDMGVTGPVGQPGSVGNTGVKGAMGPTGPGGSKGDRGLLGSKGTHGLRGPTGHRGPKGYKGQHGISGPEGGMGLAGQKGEKGAHGDTGLHGLPGTNGKLGLRGEKGDTGPVGLKGTMGPPGPKGQPGALLQKDCMCLKKPVIDTFPIAQPYPIGTHLTLTCDSSSIPKPKITWYLPTGGCGTKSVSGKVLDIPSLQPSHLGQYICDATNAYGTVSKTFNLQSNLTQLLDCDFETPNMCYWSNDPKDIGNWQLHRGPTSTSLTGPNTDHTTGSTSGYYLYTDSLTNRRHNAVLMKSPWLGASRPACLSFWYHMNGRDEGSLAIQAKNNCTGRITTYKTISGNQGDEWHLVEIQLPALPINHTLMFKSVQGNGILSDVAIDDIKYYDGKCKVSLFRTGPTEKNITVGVGKRLELDCGIEGYPQPTIQWKTPESCATQGTPSVIVQAVSSDQTLAVTNYTVHGHEGMYTCMASVPGAQSLSTTFNVKVKGSEIEKCTFDSGLLCGWTQDKYDIFDWKLQSGPTGSQETGPASDHTTHSSRGRYLYIEASSPRHPGNYAVMSSPLMKANQTACFSFYYNMYGVDTGDLRVMIEDICTHKKMTVFSTSGDKGQTWLYNSVNISAGVTKYFDPHRKVTPRSKFDVVE